MAVEVLLMRHGETEANVRQILIGREDSPFTAAGRRHVLQVARHLESLSFSCVYVSPMERTRRTADLLLAALGRCVPTQTETALSEIDTGEFTSLSFQQVRERIRERLGDLSRFGEFRYPGGESWRDVQSRAVRFVSALEDGHVNETVLLVTHAGVIAGLVARAVDEPIETHIRIRYGHDYLGMLRVEKGAIAHYSQLAGTVDSWF